MPTKSKTTSHSVKGVKHTAKTIHKKKPSPGSKSFKDRVLDVKDESKITSAISGIGKAKDVSLEEAIQISCNKDCALPTGLDYSVLKVNVQAALDRAHNVKLEDPKEKLSVQEIASIHLYTQESSFYKVLNTKLRDKNRTAAKPFFPYLKILNNALAKLPNKKVTVYRGVDKNLSKAHVKDKIVTWWALSSATSDPENTQNFLGTKNAKTFFNIEVIRGKDIRKYSSFQEEAEILLGIATSFKVTGQVGMGAKAVNVFMKERKCAPKWN